MTISTYTEKWQQVPPAVKQFLLKGVLMLVAWKVIYLGLLVPGRILDDPLTRTVGIITTDGLNWITHPHDYITKAEFGRELDVDANATSVMQQSVYYHDRKIVGVYDGCNALELFVLFVGFIICVPAAANKKWLYIIGGVALIFVVNILRCIGIAYLVQYYPQHADFA